MGALTVAGRELRALFLSPLAWVTLAMTQTVLAYVFLVQVEVFMQWQPRLAALPGAPGLTQIVVAPLLRWAGVVMMLTVPVITMRLVSEERRAGTLALLLSAPVSATQIVLGKFLAAMAFLLIALALVALMPLALLAGGTLDFGRLASGLLGLALLASAFAAAGLFMSTLTSQPPIAAVSTCGLLLLLWLLDWRAGSDGPLFAYLSILSHYNTLLSGVLDTRDLAYYALFVVTFLVLSIRRLDSSRWAR